MPEFTLTGKIVFKPAAGAVSHVGSVIPAQRAGAGRNGRGRVQAPEAGQVGAEVNSFELRQPFLGAWPPQLRLTLAVRTTESLGLAAVAAGINCDWDLGQLGQGRRLGRRLPIPVYVTLPVTAGVHINGRLNSGNGQRREHNRRPRSSRSEENSASLSQERSHMWITGVLSLSGSAELSISVGVQAGIGIAEGANVHLRADFGPEFAWTSGKRL